MVVRGNRGDEGWELQQEDPFWLTAACDTTVFTTRCVWFSCTQTRRWGSVAPSQREATSEDDMSDDGRRRVMSNSRAKGSRAAPRLIRTDRFRTATSQHRTICISETRNKHNNNNNNNNNNNCTVVSDQRVQAVIKHITLGEFARYKKNEQRLCECDFVHEQKEEIFIHSSGGRSCSQHNIWGIMSHVNTEWPFTVITPENQSHCSTILICLTRQVDGSSCSPSCFNTCQGDKLFLCTEKVEILFTTTNKKCCICVFY